MEQFPVGEQLRLVQFSPGFYQSPLPLWKPARDQFDRIDAENSHVVLIPGVKMSDMMRRARFGEHADNDPEKPAEFRHKRQTIPNRSTERLRSAVCKLRRRLA